MFGLTGHGRLGKILAIALCVGFLSALAAGGGVATSALFTPELGLMPSEELVRDLELPVRLNLADAGISRGSKAVDFSLLDTLGREVSLSGLLRERPVVLILGSYT